VPLGRGAVVGGVDAKSFDALRAVEDRDPFRLEVLLGHIEEVLYDDLS